MTLFWLLFLAHQKRLRRGMSLLKIKPSAHTCVVDMLVYPSRASCLPAYCYVLCALCSVLCGLYVLVDVLQTIVQTQVQEIDSQKKRIETQQEMLERSQRENAALQERLASSTLPFTRPRLRPRPYSCCFLVPVP